MLQQIDELLAGSLTQEDEDAVLQELEAITQVSTPVHRFYEMSKTLHHSNLHFKTMWRKQCVSSAYIFKASSIKMYDCMAHVT